MLRLQLPTKLIWLFVAPDSITSMWCCHEHLIADIYRVLLSWEHSQKAGSAHCQSLRRRSGQQSFAIGEEAHKLCAQAPGWNFSAIQGELQNQLRKKFCRTCTTLYTSPQNLYTQPTRCTNIVYLLSFFLLTHSEFCSPILTVILSNWARPWKGYEKVEVFAWLVWNHHIGTLFQSTQVCFCFKHNISSLVYWFNKHLL